MYNLTSSSSRVSAIGKPMISSTTTPSALEHDVDLLLSRPSGPKVMRVDATGKLFQEPVKTKFFSRFNPQVRSQPGFPHADSVPTPLLSPVSELKMPSLPEGPTSSHTPDSHGRGKPLPAPARPLTDVTAPAPARPLTDVTAPVATRPLTDVTAPVATRPLTDVTAPVATRPLTASSSTRALSTESAPSRRDDAPPSHKYDFKSELISILRKVSQSELLRDEPIIEKLIKALDRDDASSGKWIPYFNDEMYITSDSTCYMEADNHIVLKVGLAGILTSSPVIYPFGGVDVAYTFSETNVKFNFSDDKNTYTGVAYGKVSKINSKYIITLNKFEHKDQSITWDQIQLPAIFTYTGKVS